MTRAEQSITSDRASRTPLEMGHLYRLTVVWIGRVAVVVVPLLLWEAAANRGIIDTFAYSRPSDVWDQIVAWIGEGVISANVWSTLRSAVVGYVLGTLIGSFLAILFTLVPKLGRVYTPVMTVLNALPGFALTPLLIAAFGFGSITAVALTTIVVMFVAFFAVLGGLQSVGREYSAWARALGATELQLWRSVQLPGIVVWLISSLRIAVGLAFSAAIVAEFVGAGEGIGFLVSRSMNLYDSTGVFAGIFVIVVVIAVIDNFIRMMEKRGTRWIGFG